MKKLTPQTLNNVFESLQVCMVEIMKVEGRNCYKNPHAKKGEHIRQDKLPTHLEISIELVTHCIQRSTKNRGLEGIELLINMLVFILIESNYIALFVLSLYGCPLLCFYMAALLLKFKI